MNIKIYITASIFSSQQASTLAQKAWTLDECVAYAIENNLLVKNSFLYQGCQQGDLQTICTKLIAQCKCFYRLPYQYRFN